MFRADRGAAQGLAFFMLSVIPPQAITL